MEIINKIIYWTSLTLIFLFVIVPFVAIFTPFEYTNDELWSQIVRVRFLWLPVLILLTLFGTLKPQNSASNNQIKIILTICVSLFFTFISFVIMFAYKGKWTDKEILFNNINDKNTKIVLQEYGLGGGLYKTPTYRICKIKNILPSLIWVTEIDTTKIDRQTWQQVEEQE